MLEESEALLHQSKSMNKFLKFCIIMVLIFIVTAAQFWCIDAVLGTLSSWEYFVAIVFDTFSIMMPGVLFGLYTNLTNEESQVLTSIPVLFLIFFSTTFSPGAGVNILKELRCKLSLKSCMSCPVSSFSH